MLVHIGKEDSKGNALYARVLGGKRKARYKGRVFNVPATKTVVVEQTTLAMDTPWAAENKPKKQRPFNNRVKGKETYLQTIKLKTGGVKVIEHITEKALDRRAAVLRARYRMN